jgi:DNA-binding HxlR family transcriptional regulator
MIKKAEIKSEKDRILVLLAGTDRNMSPSEINRGIGGYLKPHTIRDRLKDLVSDGKIIKTGDKRGTKYKIAKAQGREIRAALPRLESEARREGTFLISEPAKEVYKYVTSPLLDRINVGYRKVFLDEYKPNITSYLTEEDKTTLLALGQVENYASGDGRLTQKIKSRLLQDISFNSSRLDGNTYSLLDTEILLRDGTPAEGKTATETQMLLNYQRAIEFLFEPNEQIRLNRYVLINLHAYLSESLLGSPAAEGRLRTRAMRVDIAQSAYIPTSMPTVIEECFEIILTKAKLIKNPFEQAFFLLVQLPYLQPFEDVSKQVSRLAANIPLLREKLRPLSFIDVPDHLYIQALLGVYELADVSLLRDVFLWAYRRSAMHNKTIMTSLGAPDPISVRYRSLITRSVRELVEAKTNRAVVWPAIAWLLGKDVDPNEREQLGREVEKQLLDLHEGNIKRFNISQEDFDQWKSTWQD